MSTHNISDREKWEYSEEFVYGSLQSTPENQREELAKNYLEAIITDLTAVIDYLETNAPLLKNKDMGKFYCAAEWHEIKRIIFPEERERNTSHGSVLAKYKDTRDAITTWKTDILQYTQSIEHIYEHQWFCRISTILINET